MAQTKTDTILNMSGDYGKGFSADALPPEEIAALKELEQQNRDLGAAEYVQDLQFYGKGAYELECESRTYLRYISPRTDERVLDAGAGVGRLAFLVAPRVKRLVCADLSAHALQALHSQAHARGIRNIETVQGDLCRLPDTIGTFDAAYSVEVVDHIPSHRERLAALRRLYDLLKPGGRCLVSVHCWNPRTRQARMEKEGFWGTGERRLYHYYFTSREIRGLFQEAGFQEIRLRGLRLLPGKITGRLPASFSVVETWCSMVAAFAEVGVLVIAIGRRPFKA